MTSTQRHLIQIKITFTRKKPLLKKKTIGLIKANGRNNSGKITVRHKGNGHKRTYRIIDFKRINKVIGIVCSIEYDPNRNSHIASIYDTTLKKFFYILAPKNLKIGDILKSGINIEPKLGNSLPLAEIPIGSLIHCVSLNPTHHSTISRAAGTFSYLKEKELDRTIIELSSGEQRILSSDCYATMGVVSNELNFLTNIGKAGRSRWLNCRPSVRGVAMNPVDHPHGGGEGKKSGKGKTPWGKFVKSGTTSKSKHKVVIKEIDE
jgi:large subunit ribosomal protein L2